MAFPGRPAHDFSSLFSRAPAGRFPSRPHAPSELRPVCWTLLIRIQP